jgi:hypothetical protein
MVHCNIFLDKSQFRYYIRENKGKGYIKNGLQKDGTADDRCLQKHN